MITIHSNLSIPENELQLTAGPSGGPGGQHVNKVSTRIVLEFDLDGSPSLSDPQKARIHESLGRRITRDGRLRLVCQRHRSQAANRREAIDRFAEMIREALRPRPRRVPSRVPYNERRRRLEDKKRRARLKRQRGGHDES